jgi:uncharacterized protein (DUF58 family)
VAGPHLIDANILARVDSMELLASSIVEGFILGLHKSPFRGFSVEFAEYRQYAPGDEIRHIDWKVFAKTDRYYIKQFEEETNLAGTVVLDASASMGYRSKPDGLTKLQYGATIAACLCHLMMRQRDAAGLMIFDDDVRTVLPPRLRPAHLKRIMTELQDVQPGGDTHISVPLHQLAEGMKRKGLVVLISDLLDDPAKTLGALQHFRFLGHDVMVLQIMDHAELHFPFDTLTEFTDLENGEKQLVAPEGMRPVYMKELDDFLHVMQRGCAGIKADYKLLDTERPIDIALSEYLHRRAQRL